MENKDKAGKGFTHQAQSNVKKDIPQRDQRNQRDQQHQGTSRDMGSRPNREVELPIKEKKTDLGQPKQFESDRQHRTDKTHPNENRTR